MTEGLRAALELGGAVRTAQVHDRTARDRVETRLRGLGAVVNFAGLWVLPPRDVAGDNEDDGHEQRLQQQTQQQTQQPLPRPVFGPAAPPPSGNDGKGNLDNDDDDEGPQLPGQTRRAPQPGPGPGPRSHAVQSDSSAPDAKRARREDWMMSSLAATDPAAALRLEAMTSQTARKFGNHRHRTSTDREGDATALNITHERAAATGRVALPPPSSTTTNPPLPQSQQPFRWDHDEMMAEEKIDKSRMSRVLAESIHSRFTKGT